MLTRRKDGTWLAELFPGLSAVGKTAEAATRAVETLVNRLFPAKEDEDDEDLVTSPGR